MKAIIMGGCADMAVPLLNLLRDDNDFKKVILADLNEKKAKELSVKYGAKFESAFCDATNYNMVVSLIKGNDIVFAYVGPFYIFEKKLAQCAIDAGVDYISIADDYDAYLDVIKLEDKAKEAKVKILTGFGNSPGLTQILARKGYNDLKNVYKINVNWCAGSGEDVGVSNLTHLFHIFNGTTLQWFDGKERIVETGKGKKFIEFPEPIGRNKVFYTGHAESVSLPRNLHGLEEVTLHGGVKPAYIVELLRLFSRLRLISTHKKRAALAKIFHKIAGWFASESIDKSAGRIDVYGRENGKELYKYFTYVGHIAKVTSLPAYLASKWLLKGKFKDKPGGVFAPERLIENPSKFIDELKELGVEIFESEIISI
jgi:saccharopine dehydrogenase-like NADP-dependent oxidoreductase